MSRKKVMECVPNFSEGRRKEVIERIARAFDSIPGASVVHVTSDPDANRSVVTLLGEPEAVYEAAFCGFVAVFEEINMEEHNGVHPRQGALDVCPFVPLVDMEMEECVVYSRRLAERVARELQGAIYLYQYSATRPERRDLGYLRQGEYEQLPEKLKRKEWEPDFGPIAFQPRSGVAQVGARLPLIAWNVTLSTRSLKTARKIAYRIREKGWHQRDQHGNILRDEDGKPRFHAGEFEGLMATGWWLESRQQTQITMNLIDFRKNGIGLIYKRIEEWISQEGGEILDTEVIGLLPRQVLLQAAEELGIKGENADETDLLSRVCARMKLLPPRFLVEKRLIESFLPAGIEINSL